MKQTQYNWTKNHYSGKERRLIYDTASPGLPGSTESPSLGEQANALEKQNEELVTSDTVKFEKFEATIQTLAKSVYKDANATRYTEKIEASLKHWVKKVDKDGEPFGIEGLWNFLKNEGCQTAKIQGGELEFYNQNDEKILIGELLVAQLPVKSVLDEVAQANRQKIINENSIIRINYQQENELAYKDQWKADPARANQPFPTYPNIQT